MTQVIDSAEMEGDGVLDAAAPRDLREVLAALFPPSPPSLLQSAELLAEGKLAYLREHPETANHLAQGAGAKRRGGQTKELSASRGLSSPQDWRPEAGSEEEDNQEAAYGPAEQHGAVGEEAFVALVVATAAKQKVSGFGRSTVFGRLRWKEKIAPELVGLVAGSPFETVGCLNALAKDGDEARQWELWTSWTKAEARTSQQTLWCGDYVDGLVDNPDRFYVPDVLGQDGRLLVPSVDFRRADSQQELATLYEDGQRVDLIATDPPFGVGRVDSDQRSIAFDSDPELIAPWAIDLSLPLLRDDRYALYCASDETYPRWVWEGHLLGRDELSQKVTTVTWFKTMPSGLGDSRSTFNPETECILVGHKGSPALRQWTNLARRLGEREEDTPSRFAGVADDDLRQRDGNHWTIPSPRGQGPGDKHPSRKPVALGIRIALNCSDQGDTWLDPFAGCCPFGVAAVRTQRRYLGIELEQDYFDEGVQRLKAALLHKYPDHFARREEKLAA